MTTPDTGLNEEAATAIALGGEFLATLDPLQLFQSLIRTVRPADLLPFSGRLLAGLAGVVTGNSGVVVPPKDFRFRDPTWSENPWFRRLAQSYLLWSDEMMRLTDNKEVDWRTHERSQFLMTILTTAPAPTNTLVGNPEALKRAFETGGRSLVRGFQHFVGDVLTNRGLPSQVDRSAFEVGKNIAATPGAVVHRAEMFEILQYAPTTDEVWGTPLLLLPPPVNKYYFWDLAPGRSMIEHVVGRGISVFTIVWRDPKGEQGGWGLEDYARSQLEAIDVVRDISGAEQLHIFGDCSGGLFAALLAGYEAQHGLDRVRSLTLGVTVLDFGQPCGVGMTASERSLRGLRSRAANREVISADDIASTFVWMRPNDLVWRYLINNWLLGNDPPAFDVLYWNNDGQGLPSQLALELTRITLDNSVARGGGVFLFGAPIDLSAVKCDTYAIAGMTDHISPWQACYAATQLLGGRTEFVLTPTGHVQSIIYPPSNPKAAFFTGQDPVPDPAAWLEGASKHSGSWWPHWADWLIERSGAPRPAPERLGNDRYPAKDPAPGRYVRGE